jgi:hypothetical protein
MVLSLIIAQGLDLDTWVNPILLKRLTSNCRPYEILKLRIFLAYLPYERVTTIATCDGPYNTITGYRGLPFPSTSLLPIIL